MLYTDCAWFHRKWIFDRFDVDSFSELQLCSLFLKEDQVRTILILFVNKVVI